MNPYAVLVLESLLFTLVFGGLSWLRGEGLPVRLAWEVVALAALACLLTWATHVAIHPVLFLLLIYLITMRGRLLIDLGNALSARARYAQALAVLDWAARLSSDAFGRTMARINTGVVHIREGRLEEAVAVLTEALAKMPGGRGGPKAEAACRYNLGLAYLRLGQDASAVSHLNQVTGLLPNSLYARGAEAALRRRREQRDG